MINIFFVSGMFGSTLEFILRSYTNEYTPINAIVDTDGSMHTFKKEFHPQDKESVLENLKNLSNNSITTPIYPFQKSRLPEILEAYQQSKIPGNNILVYAESTRDAELNILFQYHKLSFGKKAKVGLGMFANGNDHNIDRKSTRLNSSH